MNKLIASVSLLFSMWANAGVVSNVNVSNRYPWNGMVDVKFNLSQDAAVTVTALDKVGGTNLTMKALSEAGVPMQNGLTCLSAGDRHVVWNAATDYPNSVFENVEISVSADEQLYMVINLTKVGDKYPVTYLAGAPKSGWPVEYKTKYLVLRKIKAGTFMMGSPEGEWGRGSNETQSEQTIDKDYYIGIYEVTMAQQYLITGSVVRYGNSKGYGAWSADCPAVCSGTTFMTNLSSGLDMTASFPTEAQWEYACRGGSSSAVYTGNSPSSDFEMMIELAGYELVGCKSNGESGKDAMFISTPHYQHIEYFDAIPVGLLKPNPLGLYDMLGNRAELCANNVSKGASAWSSPSSARAARKGGNSSPSGKDYDSLGFRVVITP